jgi:hypothetical protein
VTSAASPRIRLGVPGSTGWTLSFHYTFAHSARASVSDVLRISVNGVPVFTQAGNRALRNAVWTPVTLSLDAFAGETVELLIEAADSGRDAMVEAAIDDVRVYRAP